MEASGPASHPLAGVVTIGPWPPLRPTFRTCLPAARRIAVEAPSRSTYSGSLDTGGDDPQRSSATSLKSNDWSPKRKDWLGA